MTSLRIELRDLSINFGSNLEIIGCQKAVKVVQYKFSFSFLVKQNNRLKLEISLIYGEIKDEMFSNKLNNPLPRDFQCLSNHQVSLNSHISVQLGVYLSIAFAASATQRP